MDNFYHISHRLSQSVGFPWAQSILRGERLAKTCYACAPSGRKIFELEGEVEVRLERRKGSKWPDMLGCGAASMFIISERVLRDWEGIGLRDLPASPLRIAKPYSRKLEGTEPPNYFWLDGRRLRGARLDFEASGFVGVTFCPECGARDEDILATGRKQRSGTWPMAFVEGSWNGADLFTTDLSEAYFFCTEKVLECARENRHTNFCFVPAEIDASGNIPDCLKYLRR